MSQASSEQATEQAISFEQVTQTHKLWFKRVLGLGALEAKIWVASGAQLVALMCGAAVLLVTAWLLLIAAVAVIAWQAGFSLPLTLFVGAVITLGSAYGLMVLVKRTLKSMNFTRTLDALIPSDEED